MQQSVLLPLQSGCLLRRPALLAQAPQTPAPRAFLPQQIKLYYP